MLIGYARVATQDQDLALQLDTLQAAGCEKIFTESRRRTARPAGANSSAGLHAGGAGDTLVVWKLDRLARSLKQLIETIEDWGDKQMGLKTVTGAIDTTPSGGKLIFHSFGALLPESMDLPAALTAHVKEVAKAVGRAIESGRSVIDVRPVWRGIMAIIRHILEPMFKEMTLWPHL
jgi:DNA invertase Pin-like site-specific DNA recombinase